jgi:hypothetical protein
MVVSVRRYIGSTIVDTRTCNLPIRVMVEFAGKKGAGSPLTKCLPAVVRRKAEDVRFFCTGKCFVVRGMIHLGYRMPPWLFVIMMNLNEVEAWSTIHRMITHWIWEITPSPLDSDK